MVKPFICFRIIGHFIRYKYKK